VGGFPVRFPAISIHTVGAGGGSLARRDDGGALRVGPQSAGADPGPACYGHGNLPTVTDANLVLGRLRAERFLGGDMPLDVSRAEKAIAPLAQQLGMATQAVALGIVRVANAAMERALRTISVERGIDPRDFTLVAFGGAGPLHAAYLADVLGMQRVLVPRYPGVLSALGMLVADMSRDYIHFVAQPLDDWSPQALSAAMMGLAEQARADFIQESRASSEYETLPDEEKRQVTVALRGEFTLDLRYAGQSHEINTPLMVWEGLQPALPEREAVVQHFHQLHQQYSGYTLSDRPIEVVALRLKCVAAQQRPPLAAGSLHPQLPEPPGQPACADERVQVLLHAESTRPITTALYERSRLRSGDFIAAPGIVVQLDTTCVIPYGWRARVDRYDNLLMTRV
jgi:N-methylhydantoinase A